MTDEKNNFYLALNTAYTLMQKADIVMLMSDFDTKIRWI
jgi:hypothetical protein